MSSGRMYDIVVIGAGPAGLTAGLFAARHGYRTLVLERVMTAAQIINAERVENYPGFPGGVSGFELGPLMQQQAMEAGAEFLSEEATGIEVGEVYHVVRTAEAEFQARALIIANGSSLRTLGIPGEERFQGMGVSHCASCDGPFFEGQVVGVVGGGDSAMDEALTLTQYASKVIIFHRGETLKAQKVLQDRVMSDPKIDIQWHTVVQEVFGEDVVSGVMVKNTASDESQRVDLAGLFVYTGLSPNTEYLKDLLPMDNSGHIATDIWMATGIPGIFAAGDIRQHSAAQVVASAGDGATASIAAHRYISNHNWPSD